MLYTDSPSAIACVYNSPSLRRLSSHCAFNRKTGKTSTYKKSPTMCYQVLTTALFTCAASASLATLAAKADTCPDCPAKWKCVDSPFSGVTCIPLRKRDAVAEESACDTCRDSLHCISDECRPPHAK